MKLLAFLDVLVEKPQAETGYLTMDGKINTVNVVLFIIFMGLTVYLFLTERKISALEKKINAMNTEHKQ